MPETAEDKFMRRCLDLASGAEGMTYPNPMVGSVIVHEGIIIGEGYHLKAGMPHAEVNAVNSVSDKSLLCKSTLYVSLEPCSHTGKTPPCTEFIISNKIPRVVVGTTDTSDKVSGKGISSLRDAGCEVVTGVLESDCRNINRRFFTYHEKKRPYIILKWAQSADGFIDLKRREGTTPEPNWITGMSERILVHKWRASEQAILVGANTVRTDNPLLNVRYWNGKDPVRVILSRSGNLDKYLSANGKDGTIIVFTADPEMKPGGAQRVLLKDAIPSCLQVVEYLYKTGIQSLFIEGGSEILRHFIENGMWDEARVFTGKVNFNEGVRSPSVNGKVLSDVSFEKSRLTVSINDNSNK